MDRQDRTVLVIASPRHFGEYIVQATSDALDIWAAKVQFVDFDKRVAYGTNQILTWLRIDPLGYCDYDLTLVTPRNTGIVVIDQPAEGVRFLLGLKGLIKQ